MNINENVSLAAKAATLFPITAYTIEHNVEHARTKWVDAIEYLRSKGIYANDNKVVKLALNS